MYNFIHEWEAREREMNMYHHTITSHTHILLLHVGIVKFYEEVASLNGNMCLLTKLIHQLDHVRLAFKVIPNLWYHPMEEDIYFITKFSRRGEDFPQFHDFPLDVVGKS
jgi:hypothetical protein